VSLSAPRPARRFRPELRCRCPTSRRSRSCPFQNMTGDAEQEYFVDGMVEENTSKNPDPSNSAAFSSPARCQVDLLMDFFGLAVNRLPTETNGTGHPAW
jgi:hypothetical protein